MSSTFKFHSNINEIVPWNAQYTFPSQSTKVSKQVVKLVPKNGQSFTRGQIIRIEFPAENYLNPLNSVLQFDLTLTQPTAILRFTIPTLNADNWQVKPIQWTLNGGAFTGTGGSGMTIASTYVNAAGVTTTPTITATPSGAGDIAGLPVTFYQASTGITFYNVIAAYNVAGSGITLVSNWRFVYEWPALPVATDVITVYPNVGLQRGGAHNLFNRVRIMYGSLVLEDLQQYATLVRMLFEIGVQKDYAQSSGQILEGMAVATLQDTGSTMSGNAGYITAQQLGTATDLGQAIVPDTATAADLIAPGRPRTFCVNLASGLLSQKKLIPLKWLASQLVIELTLNSEPDCLTSFSHAVAGVRANSLTAATVTLSNVNFIAEMLEFDSAFDSSVWAGLKQMGIPLKFASWHFHTFPITAGNTVIQIHERSRSIKSAFAVARTSTGSYLAYDTDRFFHDLGADFDTTNGKLTNSTPAPISAFQWRVGGRYYPAQPVRCLYGAAEAYVELSKAVDNLGDYTRGCQISAYKWAANYLATSDQSLVNGVSTSASQWALGGESFIMSCAFENPDASPGTIAGINGEEQSDIALSIVTRNGVAPTSKRLDCFLYYDAVMVVQAGNNVVLLL